MAHKFIISALIACSVSAVNGSRTIHRPLQDCPPQGYLYPRQTPIVIAPPSGSRTPSAPQPTSFNYWWPYGPNGVNPTATTAPILSSEATELETDTVDDTFTDVGSSTSPAELLSTSLATSISITPTMANTTTKESITDNPSKETESVGLIVAGNDAFSFVTLLPLFIILGVLAAATLLGWAYGRFTRQCRRDGEPVPGGPDIGGKPYEGADYDHDTIGPLYSLGVGWVDASRIHSQHNLNSGAYYAIQEDFADGEPATLSKNKSNRQVAPGWFRDTFSRRKHAFNSPSGEKGLNMPSTYAIQDHQLPINGSNASNSSFGPGLCRIRSPPTLRTANGPTAATSLLSPMTSFKPTPLLSASRHASLRRKIATKVKENDNNDFGITTSLDSAHERHQDSPEDSSIPKGDPYKRFPGRCYMSPNPDSKPSVWSPDPEMHRERMGRLRVAAEAARCTSPVSDLPANVLRPEDDNHPLPPAPAMLLSPPLQPHLFFTRTSSDDLEYDDASGGGISKLNLTRSGPSRNLSGRVNEPGLNQGDSFGLCVALNSARQHVKKGKTRGQGHLESSETLPLSPELRGAAMTKLDEIVQSHWSIRNLAGLPQSPTLYGARSLPLSHYAKVEDEAGQASIDDMLLASPGITHT